MKKKVEVEIYQKEEDEESGDVPDHSTQRDLQRSEHLEGRHEVGRTGDTQHVCNGKQDVGNDLRIVRLPIEPSYIDHHHTQTCIRHHSVDVTVPPLKQMP